MKSPWRSTQATTTAPRKSAATSRSVTRGFLRRQANGHQQDRVVEPRKAGGQAGVRAARDSGERRRNQRGDRGDLRHARERGGALIGRGAAREIMWAEKSGLHSVGMFQQDPRESIHTSRVAVIPTNRSLGQSRRRAGGNR